MNQLLCIFFRASRRNIKRLSVALITLFITLTAQTAMAATKTVSYIDADGTQKTVTATVLTGNETNLGTYGTNWYVVYNDISYSGKIYCDLDVNIILCDGVKMTMNNDDSCISGSSFYTLTIYGQTNGTGTLEAKTTGSYNTIGHGGRMVINGGTVNATNTNDYQAAISSEKGVTINGGIVNATCPGDGGYGITSGGDVTINGGIVNATSNVDDGYGIRAGGTITLGWTNTSDRITASSYRGTVTIADGKVFEDTKGNLYVGTLTSAELNAIKDQELAPNLDAYTVKVVDVDGVTVTADCRLAKAGHTVNLTAKATEAGYFIGVKYNDDTDHALSLNDNGQCSFEMPAANVEVSGTKTAAFAAGDGSEEKPYLIKNTGDWNDFCSLINSVVTYDINKDKCFKLGNDIEEVTSRIGANSSYVFMGTFDGGGHALNVTYGSCDFCAPFGYVSNVTIKNLHVAGTINTRNKYAAGIVGNVTSNSTVTIANCRSSVTIKSSVSGKSYHGGFVGHMYGKELNINDCVFDGKILSVGSKASTDCGGFVGVCGKTNVVNLTNCLYAPASGNLAKTYSKTFVYSATSSTRNLKFDNCYYTRVFGTEQGTQADYLLSEDESVPEDLDGTMVFRREFNGGKASTICLPFEYTPKKTEGTYYSFKGIELEGDEYVATMTAAATKLEANTPYVFIPAATDTYVPVLYHGKADYNAEKLTTTSGDWTFRGTYEQLKYGENLDGPVYGFASKDKEVEGVKVSAGEFVKAKDGAGVKPMRCYLTYKKNEEFVGARAVTRGIEENLPQSITVKFVSSTGNTTAIATLNTQTGEITTDDAWYTLSGRKLDAKPSQRGVYIHNNQKIVINR